MSNAKVRSGQEPREFIDKLYSRLLHLDVSPRRHLYTFLSNPECHAKKPAAFAATVIRWREWSVGRDSMGLDIGCFRMGGRRPAAMPSTPDVG